MGFDRSAILINVPIGKIRIDPRVQRTLIKPWVKTLAASFDPFYMDPLFGTRSDDGFVYINDGQHRLEVLRFLGYEGTVPVLLRSRTLSQEARQFDISNNTNSVAAVQKFKTKLAANDPVAMGVDSVLQSLELRIDPGPGIGHIQSAQAPLKIYRAHGYSQLHAVLSAIDDALGREPGTFQSWLMEGLSDVIARSSKMVLSPTELRKVLRRRGVDDWKKLVLSDSKYCTAATFRRVFTAAYNRNKPQDRQI